MEGIIDKHISTVRAGDVILCCDGIARTVCDKDISRGFMGIAIFGDSWRSGTQLVKVLSSNEALSRH